ncbi:MAG: malto-oligosyltrehalose synthase [Candidatus Omnitrophica bacterium]|nr:malto-oligosyltrehalose synthase [Candidatus Omnitrophota bacterium]
MNIPLSTYRIQLCSSFTFKMARDIIPYLAQLGISHVYTSPIFKARKGSTHGYDVVDPREINTELGGMKNFTELTRALKENRMYLLQDIVPNHMAFDSENGMLMDIFENGKSSAYYRFFDIEWDHPYENLKGRVLVPVLGKFYAECLEAGEIQLCYGEKGLGVRYYDLLFPLKIESYHQVLSYNTHILEARLGKNSPDFINYIGALQFLKTMRKSKKTSIRSEQIRHIKGMLWDLSCHISGIKDFIDETIHAINGVVGAKESFDLLDTIISEQYYRLSFWKVATEEINYRRFFTINDLISVRVEDRDIFEHTHSLIFKLCRDRAIDGLRIDHIDGLYDPATYLKWLKGVVGDKYVIAEKILEADEELPRHWPLQGTTGYDFLNYVNGLFCNKEHDRIMSKTYYKYTGLFLPYEDLVYEKKRLIIGKHMAGNIDNLAQHVKKISAKERFGRDITLYGLRRALVEVMALFPVYRTYINNESFGENDQGYIKKAIEKAKEKRPELWYEINFIEKFLLLQYDSSLSGEEKTEWLYFVMSFQQQTSPLMAKGFEDTILYIYNRLISLNEVGGNPIRFGYTVEEFHDFNKKRYEVMPYSMNATATHDTKRGEDVRARINVLSECADEWRYHLKQWTKLNRTKKTKVNTTYIPTANDEYFLYQTLLGTYPFYDEPYYAHRIKHYSIKAVREAKVHTAWIKPDEAYEHAFISFVEKILKPYENNRFLNAFLPFQKKVAFYGIFNSLSQTLLKMTSPGVPDFYQGTELWDLSLVDPDNRRAVDFQLRKKYLDYIARMIPKNILTLIKELLDTKEDGRVKLFLIHRIVHARKKYEKLFQNGSYVPLTAEGECKDSVVAFARNYEKQWAIIVIPRFLSKIVKEGEFPLGEFVWKNTRIVLPENMPGTMIDVVTSQKVETRNTISIGNALKYFPVSLLTHE